MSITPQVGPLSALGPYTSPPSEIEGVSFWPRVAARVIDFIVHYLLSLVSGFLFAVLLLIAAAGHPNPLFIERMRRTGIAVFVFSLLGSIAYEIICEGLHGSTLGKLALGMTVVQEDGTPCRIKSALIRSFAYLVDALFFGLIGYMAMKGSPQMQRHGDEWANTIVCKRSAVATNNLRRGGRFIVALFFALMLDSILIIVGLLLNFTS
ncbi:MAG TPA: RDD family protein [Terriglobales bacterium]|nr:RDD family protein [Terriglobales bacterium]